MTCPCCGSPMVVTGCDEFTDRGYVERVPRTYDCPAQCYLRLPNLLRSMALS